LNDRKILVLLDNCAAHPIITFSNIKFVFLSPNTTSLIQPIDQGMIYNFKLKYRQLFLNAVFDLDPVNLKGNIAKFNIFNSVEFIILAWN
jgi:hypothetical protein